MTAEIPDDIMQAAEKALDNLLCNCVESCGSYDALRQASITDIAIALMAEREACARMAEDDNHFPQEGDHIAKQIREPRS